MNLHMRMGTTAAQAAQIEQEHGATDGAVVGTAQQAIDAIKAYEEAGASRVSIAIRPPIEWDALQAFVEEVMPAVQ